MGPALGRRDMARVGEKGLPALGRRDKKLSAS